MGTLGNSVDKYVTGRMLQTSNDRRWSHLLAEIWSHEAGELPSQLPRDTEIAIQLRGHSLVDRRGAGMHQRTLSKKGTVWLCPGRDQRGLHQYRKSDAGMPSRFPARQTLRRNDAEGSRYRPVGNLDPVRRHRSRSIHRVRRGSDSQGNGSRDPPPAGCLIESLGNALSAHLVHTYAATAVRLKQSIGTDKPLDPETADARDGFHQRLCRAGLSPSMNWRRWRA